MVKTLTGSQFANTFCLRPQQFAWLLGAGASASAGIPTGYAMIADFKKRLFCQMSGCNPREVDANDPIWMERIDLCLAKRSDLPSPDDPTEYAKVFQAIYPNQEDRRLYIDNAVRQGTPSFAHRVLAALLTTGKIPCVFTTNFDQLIESSTAVTDHLMPAPDRANMTTAAIDSAARAELCLRESRWPLLAKLHGDYQSVELKNTTDELKSQDEMMRRVLTTACARFGIVVVGYSGRDESIMAALSEAITQPNAFPGGVFWVASSAKSVLPAVNEFLARIAESGVSAAIVESPTFDELAGDLFDQIDFPPNILQHVKASRSLPIFRDIPLPTTEQRKFPVLQCSAIPILSMPSQARRIQVNTPITTAVARDLLKQTNVRALVAANGKEIAAFGADADLLRAFSTVGGQIAGTVELHPDKDSWARGLIYDALTRAVCRWRPLLPRLRRKGHAVIVASGLPADTQERITSRNKQLANLQQAYSSTLIGKVDGPGYPYSEGVQLRLDYAVGRWWCAFDPFTDVKWPRLETSEASSDNADKGEAVLLQHEHEVMDWQRERWAARRNKEWSKIISEWAKLLSGNENCLIHALGVSAEAGVDAAFRLSSVTGWSRPSHEHDYFLRGGR